MDSFPPIKWTPGLTLEDIKMTVIQQAYEYHGRSRKKTAEALGISVRCLYNWLNGLNKGLN